MTLGRPAIAALAALAVAGCGNDAGPPAGDGGDRPIVLLVPGSAFGGVSEAAADELSVQPETWNELGATPIPVAYRAGRQGFDDVLAAVATAREANPDARLCLYGESSGGTFALLAAARRPGDVACVIAVAAPTDADTWRRAPSRIARYYATDVWGGHFGTGAADDGFEPYDVWRADRPSVPALLIYAITDRTVPAQQGRLMAGVAGPGGSLTVLDDGPLPFVHSGVSLEQFERSLAQIGRFVRQAG